MHKQRIKLSEDPWNKLPKEGGGVTVPWGIQEQC